MNYKLICVIPLYKTTSRLVMPLIASLTRHNGSNLVFYKFYYDDTVPQKILSLIKEILIACQTGTYGFDFEYCKNSHSGYKRNLGIQYALKYNIKYIWFIDQDDWLLEPFVFDSAIQALEQNNTPIIRVDFDVPKNLGDFNIKTIKGTATMPWQYVFEVESIKDYKFSETIEYGSDISFVIFYLLDHKYLIQEDVNKFYWINMMPLSKIPLYFYNYLNSSSVMGTVKTDISNPEYNKVIEMLAANLKEIKNGK